MLHTFTYSDGEHDVHDVHEIDEVMKPNVDDTAIGLSAAQLLGPG